MRIERNFLVREYALFGVKPFDREQKDDGKYFSDDVHWTNSQRFPSKVANSAASKFPPSDTRRVVTKISKKNELKLPASNEDKL